MASCAPIHQCFLQRTYDPVSNTTIAQASVNVYKQLVTYSSTTNTLTFTAPGPLLGVFLDLDAYSNTFYDPTYVKIITHNYISGISVISSWGVEYPYFWENQNLDTAFTIGVSGNTSYNITVSVSGKTINVTGTGTGIPNSGWYCYLRKIGYLYIK